MRAPAADALSIVADALVDVLASLADVETSMLYCLFWGLCLLSAFEGRKLKKLGGRNNHISMTASLYTLQNLDTLKQNLCAD